MARKAVHTATLEFFARTKDLDGTTIDERESSILRIMFQLPGSTPFDRVAGGGIEDFEQRPESDEIGLLLQLKDVVESIYRLNQKRRFEPFIVVGFTDLVSEIVDGKRVISINHRLWQDLSQGERATAVTGGIL